MQNRGEWGRVARGGRGGPGRAERAPGGERAARGTRRSALGGSRFPPRRILGGVEQPKSRRHRNRGGERKPAAGCKTPKPGQRGEGAPRAAGRRHARGRGRGPTAHLFPAPQPRRPPAPGAQTPRPAPSARGRGDSFPSAVPAPRPAPPLGSPFPAGSRPALSRGLRVRPWSPPWVFLSPPPFHTLPRGVPQS